MNRRKLLKSLIAAPFAAVALPSMAMAKAKAPGCEHDWEASEPYGSGDVVSYGKEYHTLNRWQELVLSDS